MFGNSQRKFIYFYNSGENEPLVPSSIQKESERRALVLPTWRPLPVMVRLVVPPFRSSRKNRTARGAFLAHRRETQYRLQARSVAWSRLESLVWA